MATPNTSRRTGTNENINTYNSAGGADYTSLTTWEGDTDIDLVTATQSEVLECAAGTHDDSLILMSATTNSSYFRIVRAVEGAEVSNGWGTGATFEGDFGSGMRYCFQIYEPYASIQDVGLNRTGGSYAGFTGTLAFGGNGNVGMDAVGCHVKNEDSYSSADKYGILCQSNDNTVQTSLVNCIVEDVRPYTGSSAILGSNVHDVSVYNCTLNGAGHLGTTQNGLNEIGTGTCVHKNTVVSGFTTNVSGTWTGTTSSTSVKWIDKANSNYDLSRYDTDCLGQGTDLSADATFDFDDDFTKRYRYKWDIGAYLGRHTRTANSSRRSGTAENIKTYGSAGNNRDYTSLATWEGDTDLNLVSLGYSPVLECFADADHNDVIDMDGSVVNATYFRTLRAATGHENLGVKGAGVKFYSTSTSSHVILSREDYSNISDIEASITVTGASTSLLAFIFSTADEATFVGCLASDMVSTSPTASAKFGGFYIQTTGASTKSYAINCVASGIDSGYYASIQQVHGFENRVGVNVFYNCTADDIGNNSHASCVVYGFVETGAETGTAKNCVVSNLRDSVATYGFYNSWSETTNDDSDNVVYVDQANGDYRLDNTDRACRTGGTDLSADATFAFDDDIRFYRRKPDTPWDIGAFENISSRRVAWNENVNTFGTDYTVVATWEGDTDIDLVTATQSEVLEFPDGAQDFDSAHATIAGATASSRYRRILRGVKNDGQKATGTRLQWPSGNTDGEFILIHESFACLQDIALVDPVGANKTTASHSLIAVGSNDIENVQIVGYTILDLDITMSPTRATGYCLYTYYTDPLFICNVMLGDYTNNATQRTVGLMTHPWDTVSQPDNVYTYSYTIADMYGASNTANVGHQLDGIDTTKDLDLKAKNVCAFGTDDDNIRLNAIEAGVDVYDFDASCAIGTPNDIGFTDADPTCEDIANHDYRPASTDNILIGRGRPMVQDGNFPYDDDIAGIDRGNGVDTPWDIGAFAFVAASTIPLFLIEKLGLRPFGGLM